MPFFCLNKCRCCPGKYNCNKQHKQKCSASINLPSHPFDTMNASTDFNVNQSASAIIRILDTSGNVITGLNGVFFRRSIIEIDDQTNAILSNGFLKFFGPLFYTTNGIATIYELPFFLTNKGIPISITINENSLNAAGYTLANGQSDTVTLQLTSLNATTFDFYVIPIPVVETTLIFSEITYQRYATIDTPDDQGDTIHFQPIEYAVLSITES